MMHKHSVPGNTCLQPVTPRSKVSCLTHIVEDISVCHTVVNLSFVSFSLSGITISLQSRIMTHSSSTIKHSYQFSRWSVRINTAEVVL